MSTLLGVKHHAVSPSEPPLAGAVESVFCLESYEPEHRTERLVPSGRTHLVIELDGAPRAVLNPETKAPVREFRGAWFSGAHSERLSITATAPGFRLAAVQFAPGEALAFTHTPIDGLTNRVVHASEVFGDSVTQLRDSLIEETEPEAVVAAIVGWLSERHEAAHEPPPIVRRALKRLREAPGDVAFTAMVEQDGSVSYKRFIELFRRHAGLTPKMMQRVLRFVPILERVVAEERVDWASLAAELGYADQSHLIREFRAFSGYRPGTFVEDGYERVNFFPDD